MDYETWSKVMKVVAPDIIKMEVSNVSSVLPILFSVYFTYSPIPEAWTKGAINKCFSGVIE